MVLICYDGSADADAAIDAVAAMMPGQTATILTVWEPFVEVMTRFGPGLEMWPAGVDTEGSTPPPRARRSSAREGGAERARAAGLQAEGRRDPTRHDDRRHDHGGGRIDLGECDRPGDARPDRSEVGDARQRVPRGPSPRGPAGDDRPVGRTGGQTVRTRILSRLPFAARRGRIRTPTRGLGAMCAQRAATNVRDVPVRHRTDRHRIPPGLGHEYGPVGASRG